MTCICCKVRKKIIAINKNLTIIMTSLLVLCMGGIIAIIKGFISPDPNIDFFTCAAALFSAAAITYQAHRSKINDNLLTSRFYLEKYKETSELILQRLNSDLPTRRISWVTAADLADKLMALTGKITSDVDKDMLNIHKRNLAHELYEFISLKSALYFTGNNSAKSLKKALERPIPVAYPGPIVQVTDLLHVTEESIRSILNILNELWKEKAGDMFKNEDEFQKFINRQHPNVAEYLQELNKKKTISKS